jgi:hypothetical protein
MACFFDTMGGADSGTSDKFFIVDAAAHDESDGACDDALAIRLYTKTPAGRARTLRWTGQELRFYVHWPGTMVGLDMWLSHVLAEFDRFSFTHRKVRRTHLMGFQADPVSGQAFRHLYVEFTVGSIQTRRAMTWALRPQRGGRTGLHERTRSMLPVEQRSTGVDIWHGSVCPIQQAMVRAGGAPGMWITCTPDAHGDVEQVEFLPGDDAPPPVLRCLAYDIETGWEPGKLREGAFPQVYDPRGRIIQVGMTYMDGPDCVVDRVVCLGDTGTPEGVEVKCVRNESELLNAFAADIRNMDPDCVTGFNVHGFDVNWLCGRAEYITIFNRCENAAAAVGQWHWATDFMSRFPTKAPRDEVRRWLRNERAPPGVVWNTRGGCSPDMTAQRLSSYRSTDDVRAAWAYFNALPPPHGFWKVGRNTSKLSSMSIHVSKMGADLQRFEQEGRVTVDLYSFVKENYGSKMKSFSLRKVAEYFLPDLPKIDLDYGEMFRHFDSGDPARRAIIAEYCARDCAVRPPGWAPRTPPGWAPRTPPGWAPRTPPGWAPRTPPGWAPRTAPPGRGRRRRASGA